MAMQQKTPGGAALDLDQADAAADAFRPSWDAGDADAAADALRPSWESDDAPAGPAVIVGTPVIALGQPTPEPPVPRAAPAPPAPVPTPKNNTTVLGLSEDAKTLVDATVAAQAAADIAKPQPLNQTVMMAGAPAKPVEARAPAPSSEALDSAAVIEVAKPVEAKSPSIRPSAAPKAKSAPPIAFTPIAVDPFANVRAPAVDAEDDLGIPKKKSGTGLLIGVGVVCVGILGIGLYLKLGSSDAAPKTDTKPATSLGAAAATTNDIPPPPPKDELPATPETATAKAPEPPPKPEPTTAPAPPPPTPPPAVKPEPAPKVVHHAPVTPKATPATPKATPKAGGGIVRDSPF